MGSIPMQLECNVSINASAKSIRVINIIFICLPASENCKSVLLCSKVKYLVWVKYYSNNSDGSLTNENWNNIDQTRYFGNLESGVSLCFCVFMRVYVYTVSNSKSTEVVFCSHCVPSCDIEKPCRSGCQKEALKYLSDYYRRCEPFKHPSSHTMPFSSVHSFIPPAAVLFLSLFWFHSHIPIL